MKTMLVCITHFGKGKFNNEDDSVNHVHRCLSIYNAFQKYKLDVHLFITEPFDASKYTNLKIIKHEFGKNIGVGLAQQHIPIMKDNIDKYDLYLYVEDDTMVTEENVDTFLEVQSQLPLPFVTGFLTYENLPNDPYKFYVCHHISCSVPRGGKTLLKDSYVIKGKEYFEPYNLHQGSYLLTNTLFKFAIERGYGIHQGVYQGPLENAATHTYWKCGFIKVFPRNSDILGRLSIHHLPDRYVTNFQGMYNKNTLPNNEKLAVWQPELKPVLIH